VWESNPPSKTVVSTLNCNDSQTECGEALKERAIFYDDIETSSKSEKRLPSRLNP